MGVRLKKMAETWENRQAIGLSRGQRAITLELKEVLQKRDWKMIELSSSEDSVFAQVASGQASMMILDDQDLDPASLVQRQQLFHQIACMTPTLILSSQATASDHVCMQSMGSPVLVAKPLTPKDLLEGIDLLCERWSEGYLLDLRRAAQKMVQGQVQTGFRLLTDCVQSGEKAPLAIAALALYYRRIEDLKATERILVSALKQGVFELSTVLPLIDLYLYAGAPKLALRIIETAYERFQKPAMLAIDAVQALVMLNRVKETLPYLQQVLASAFYGPLARLYLPRLYYACGEWDLFDKSIRYRAETFDEYQRAWHLLSDEEAAKRKLSYQEEAATRKAQSKTDKKAEGEEATEASYRSLGAESPALAALNKPFFRPEHNS